MIVKLQEMLLGEEISRNKNGTLYGAYRVSHNRIRVAPKSGYQKLIVTVTDHIRSTVFIDDQAIASNVFLAPDAAFRNIVAWAKEQANG